MMCYTCTNDICYVCIFSSFFWNDGGGCIICGFALDHNIEYTIIYLFNIILPIYNYYRHHDKNGGDKIYLLLF